LPPDDRFVNGVSGRHGLIRPDLRREGMPWFQARADAPERALDHDLQVSCRIAEGVQGSLCEVLMKVGRLRIFQPVPAAAGSQPRRRKLRLIRQFAAEVPMITKVEVDTRTCIGCGTCWVSCPESFREVAVGEDYKAAATGALAPEPLLRGAAAGCPSLSISLYDAAGELLYPTEAQREELRQQQQW
jgi:ferredoxin